MTWTREQWKDSATDLLGAVRRHRDAARTNPPIQDFLERSLENVDGIILDIGSGDTSQTYLPRGKKVVKTDLIPQFLQNQQKNAAAAAQALPFGDNIFEAVISKQLYGYLENPQDMINEMVRTVQSGGLVMIIDYTGNLALHPSRATNFIPKQVKSDLEERGINNVGMKTLLTVSGFPIILDGKEKIDLVAVWGIKA